MTPPGRHFPQEVDKLREEQCNQKPERERDSPDIYVAAN